MISKRDSKPFQIKFPIGIMKTNKSDMQYEDSWHLVYGLISNPNGIIKNNIYGYEGDFDKVIIMVATPLTRQINYDTLFIIDNMPTINFEKGDYTPKYIYPEYNGEIVIGLVKKEAINIPKIYFENDLGILYYQINFDKTTLKAYVPYEQILPFKRGDFVWTREPVDANETKHRLKFISESKIGHDSYFQPFRELIFKEE